MNESDILLSLFSDNLLKFFEGRLDGSSERLFLGICSVQRFDEEETTFLST